MNNYILFIILIIILYFCKSNIVYLCINKQLSYLNSSTAPIIDYDYYKRSLKFINEYN